MVNLNDFNNIVIQTKKIFQEYDLCENCLGRLFSKRLRVSSNNLLGKKIRKKIQKKSSKCYICNNLFSNLQPVVAKMLASSSSFQFSSFLIGAILKPSLIDKDDLLKSKFQLKGIDSIKTDLTREIGKKFKKKTKKKIDYVNPDITFTLNFKTNSCELRSKPIFLYARYTKKIRGFSQKQKSCENCNGKGCFTCNYHGISKFDSIEGQICKYLFNTLGAKQAKISWVGGEDRQSLVLGGGRPFFIKVINPKKRKIKVEKKINLDKISILGMKLIKQLPKEPIRFRSIMQIQIFSKHEIHSSSLRNLQSFKKIPIEILGKSGKITKKLIHKLSYKKTSPNSFRLNITVDGGFPIKRFIEGNSVFPNVSQILGLRCKCKEFDFYGIEL